MMCKLFLKRHTQRASIRELPVAKLLSRRTAQFLLFSTETFQTCHSTIRQALGTLQSLIRLPIDLRCLLEMDIAPLARQALLSGRNGCPRKSPSWKELRKTRTLHMSIMPSRRCQNLSTQDMFERQHRSTMTMWFFLNPSLPFPSNHLVLFSSRIPIFSQYPSSDRSSKTDLRSHWSRILSLRLSSFHQSQFPHLRHLQSRLVLHSARCSQNPPFVLSAQ